MAAIGVSPSPEATVSHRASPSVRLSSRIAMTWPSTSHQSIFSSEQQKSFWPGGRIERDPRVDFERLSLCSGVSQRFSRFTTLGGNAMASESLAYGAMVRYRRADIPDGEREQLSVNCLNIEFLGDGDLQPTSSPSISWSSRTSSLVPTRRRVRSATGLMVFDEGGNLPGQKAHGAYGLSGSPVWRIGGSGESIRDWSPTRSRLVGIVTDWNREERILIATSAEKILEFVSAG